MRKQKTKVEVRMAYAWDCPECGREFFERAIMPEFSAEDLAELRQEHGVESWETGHFTVKPETVTCPHCQFEFDTVDYGCDCEEE